MEQIDYIFFKIKEKIGAEKDKEVAEFLNIPYRTINNWRQRKKIPKEKIIKIAEKLKISVEELSDNTNFSNNTHSVIVNGTNNGSIVNSHQIKVSNDLMEFIELYQQYGNKAMLENWVKSLLDVKKMMEK